MRKKITLRLFILTAFLAVVWSCQQELMQAGQEYDAQLQKNTVEWLSRLQLEKNHPKVLDKINQISPNNASESKGIYTDAENGFSIDTEEAYFVKDANGIVTYTFKIERDSEKDESVLENLILKDIGEGNFFAYFITYDAAALSNSREKPLSPEELSHHISLYTVGKKTSAEIFGKLNSCPVTFYPVGTYVYVPGHQCIEGLHDYGEPCAYLGTSNAATQGGYEVVYNITVQETPGSCGGTGSSGGMGTTPVSGSGGNINLPELDDPCVKIKNKFNDAKFKEKVAAIDKPEVFDYDHEMGYAVGYPPPNTGVTETQYQPMENVLGSHNVTLPAGNQYFGFIHSHNNESDGGHPVKIFSPADLATFLTSCVANADVHGGVTDAYAMVITSEGNYMLQFTGLSSGFGVGPNTKKFWLSWYEREVIAIQNEDGTIDQGKVEKMFLRFLKEKVAIDGVELYQVEKITGKATKLSLDASNNVILSSCP
ncbi:hypothetical protein ACQWU4_00810 [Chryseobacterium sp. MIQD13]|uniref:hypothetical protein n=1 Tax=Chryseobacterium sp. MIQD13 TaxID=3422310 RepID=UPI003D294611